MLWKPVVTRILSKLLFEFLPAVVVTTVGSLLLNQYTRAPDSIPAAEIASPSSAELMRIVREEHAQFMDYVKRSAQAREQASLAAAQETKRIEGAEKAAQLAQQEARAAETKALAAAARAADKSERKVAARPPAPHPDKSLAEAPLQLHPVASAMPPDQPAIPPAAVAARSDDNIIVAKLRDVTATVERIPSWIPLRISSWVRSATD